MLFYSVSIALGSLHLEEKHRLFIFKKRDYGAIFRLIYLVLQIVLQNFKYCGIIYLKEVKTSK